MPKSANDWPEIILFDKDIRKELHNMYCDKETISTINKVYKDHNIIVDPHTAVGIGVVKKIPLLKSIYHIF